jgi:hypothetical protein
VQAVCRIKTLHPAQALPLQTLGSWAVFGLLCRMCGFFAPPCPPATALPALLLLPNSHIQWFVGLLAFYPAQPAQTNIAKGNYACKHWGVELSRLCR